MDCGGGRGRIEQYVGMLLCLALHGPEWGGGGGAEILFTPHRTFYRHTAATCPPSTFYFMVITPSCRIRKQQQKHQSDELTRHPHFITRHELHICTIVVKSALNSTDRSLEQKQRKTECRWYKKRFSYCNVLKKQILGSVLVLSKHVWHETKRIHPLMTKNEPLTLIKRPIQNSY